jgi:two-component system alkaline phosphatase synthesis response regulator PhoP
MQATGSSRGKTILVVDDDHNTLHFVRFALKQLNATHELRYASNGYQAMEYLQGACAEQQKHQAPDLILLDLRMPLMDGFALLEWLRGQKQFERLPVVVLTGSLYSPDAARAQQLGASSLIVKAFELLEFVNSVSHVLDTFFAPGFVRINDQSSVKVKSTRRVT